MKVLSQTLFVHHLFHMNSATVLAPYATGPWHHRLTVLSSLIERLRWSFRSWTYTCTSNLALWIILGSWYLLEHRLSTDMSKECSRKQTALSRAFLLAAKVPKKTEQSGLSTVSQTEENAENNTEYQRDSKVRKCCSELHIASRSHVGQNRLNLSLQVTKDLSIWCNIRFRCVAEGFCSCSGPEMTCNT